MKSIYQGLFDSETVEDYDLTEMLKDASENVRTQKLLLVGHSQGNFYANSFYDTVAGKIGGVPAESIGVYSVATPSGRVAGGGKWMTSDTDNVIAGLVGRMLSRNIMTPNTHIALQPSDDPLGHHFSSVYLKYRGDEIVADIKYSLDQLRTNTTQDVQAPCLAPPKLTLWHEIIGRSLAVADPFAKGVATGAAVSGRSIAATGAGIYAGVAAVIDTAHTAAKLVVTTAKYFVESTVALAKEVLTGGIGTTREKNLFPNKLSASLLATSGELVESTRGNNTPVPTPVPPLNRGETAPPQTTPVAAPVPSLQPPQNSEPSHISSSQPAPELAPSTFSVAPPSEPIMFGVSETPPAASLAAPTVTASDTFAAPSTPANFSSSFDSLNLRLTLTWASSTDPDTADNLLSYQFNYSTSSELAATNWVTTSSPKILSVTYPNSYTLGVRAVDNVGKVSAPATLTWSFPSSFALLPSQTDHSYQLPRGKQKILITSTTTIDAVAMWLGGSTGDYCCSQSYMRIFTDAGTLTATSEGNANGEITLGATESAHEVLYVFDSAVTLNPNTYWLVPTKGPSGTTNSTTIFGSSNDTYADGLWLDVNGNDEGRDAYFRVRLAN